MVSDFRRRCIKVAERFLQNIVIVDDDPYFETPQEPQSLERPSRTQPRTTEEAANARTSGNRSLDAQTLVNSFAERGLICAIVAPRSSSTVVATVAAAAKRADMVVLDWQMRGDNGKNALAMLNKILDVDAGKQLRLIAIYTADPDICGIARKIANDLNNRGMQFQTDDLGVELSYLHCRIVIYAKDGTYLNPELQGRSIGEARHRPVSHRRFRRYDRGLAA